MRLSPKLFVVDKLNAGIFLLQHATNPKTRGDTTTFNCFNKSLATYSVANSGEALFTNNFLLGIPCNQLAH